MRHLLMIFSMFAFLATSLAGLAHAETICDPSSERCASAHMAGDNTQDGDMSHEGCDLSCGGCHVHCHGHASFASQENLFLQVSLKDEAVIGPQSINISDLIYGLKRPPKA